MDEPLTAAEISARIAAWKREHPLPAVPDFNGLEPSVEWWAAMRARMDEYERRLEELSDALEQDRKEHRKEVEAARSTAARVSRAGIVVRDLIAALKRGGVLRDKAAQPKGK